MDVINDVIYFKLTANHVFFGLDIREFDAWISVSCPHPVSPN
jgi:hypothetical protein